MKQVFNNYTNMRKQRGITLATVLLLVGSVFFLTGCQEDETINNSEIDGKENQQVLSRLTFVDSKNHFDQVFWQAFIDRETVNVQHIGFAFVDQAGEISEHGGGRSFADHEEVVLDDVRKMLSMDDQNMKLFFDEQRRIIESQGYDQKQLEDLQKEEEIWQATSKTITNVIVFTDMVVFMERKEYNELLLRNDVIVDIVDLNEMGSEERQANDSHNKDSYNWTPDSGYLSIGPYGSTTRMVYNRFKGDIKPFNLGYTYEHDFFLNNYSSSSLPGTYLSRSQNSSGFPVCTWYSNMPNKYLDTRLFDDNNFQGTGGEVPYTIGCGEGYNLNANYNYYTRIITSYGDANADNGKLNAQAGEQIPIGCTSVWCSFSLSQKRLISAWNVSVPGSKSWSL